MPPAAKRNFSVILFDVNASNKNEGLLALLKICALKWLSETRDTFKLILSNTKKSRNAKGFENLYETNISNFDPQLVFKCVEAVEAEEGNWLEAILLAIHHLKEQYEMPGIITLQILFVTNLEGSSQDLNEANVNKIIKDLKEYDIYLYIIGPKVKFPYTITSVDDVSNCMKKIQVDENIHPLLVAKKIVTNTENSVMCDLKVGINLFFSFKNPHGSQPWKVPLSFGTQLEIPASTVKIYKKEAPFKLSQDPQTYLSVLLEDESVKVEYQELVSGVTRHGKFVKVEENDMFKVEGPRSFSIIGFTSRTNIPEYYIQGEGTFLVLPDHEKPQDCCQTIYDLVDILAKQKKYAIARRIYNTNNKPKFFVLVPQPQLNPKCFVMAELPYTDDVMETYKFTDLKSAAEENNEETEAFTQFFKSIDICNKNCKVNVPLGPTMMLDTYASKLANETVKKYLNQDFDFSMLEINDLEETESNEFLEALKATWPENDIKTEDDDVD